jgi:hypothetical protein
MNTINPNYVPASFYDSSGQLTVSEAYAQQVSNSVAERVANMPPAEAEMFLALLRSADLAPSGELPPEEMNAALSRLETAAAALDRLFNSEGNIIDLLARVMIEQAAQQRKDALEERLAAREQAKSQLLDQAGKMKEAAEKMLSGALVAMITAIVVAVVTVAISAYSIGKAGQGLTAAKDAKGLEGGAQQARLAQASALSGKGQAWGGVSQSLSGLATGVGNYAKADYEAQSKKIEAEGSEMAAEAQYSQSQADIKKEMQDALNQLIQSIINFIKEMKEAEVNMMQAITRG